MKAAVDRDPVLDKAMKEIEAVLHKYDIAAVVHLVSTSHAKYTLHIDKPSWSAVKFEGTDADTLRVRTKRTRGDPNEMIKLDATVHMLCCLKELAQRDAAALNYVVEEISKQVKIDSVAKRGYDS